MPRNDVLWGNDVLRSNDDTNNDVQTECSRLLCLIQGDCFVPRNDVLWGNDVLRSNDDTI